MKPGLETLLNRHFDNETSSIERRQVDDLLEHSYEAREYLEILESQGALLKLRYDRILQDQVPSRLIPKELPRPATATRHTLFPMAMAASLAVAVTVGALFYVETSMQQSIDQLSGQIAQLRNQALEHQPSGTTVSWSDAKGKYDISLTPIKTYRTVDNRFCREYHEIIDSADGSEERRGIACRSGKNNWPVRKTLSTPTNTGNI